MLVADFVKGVIFDGRYRIVGTIGQGGMAVVFAVEDLKLERKLRAMKVTTWLPSGVGSATASEEASMLMRLSHPHLPAIYDYFPPSAERCEVLIMDYIDGQTIASIIRNCPLPFTFLQIVEIGLQLCSALCYLHNQAQPIIHRDLKPSNVMLDHKGVVKLIDFGISRQYKAGQQQDTVQLGTVGYAAPEQAGGGQSDVRTDIYGLGALLYYIASGGKPYVRQQSGSCGIAQNLGHLVDIPVAFTTILEKMLQTSPQFRYRSMEEAQHALKMLVPAIDDKYVEGRSPQPLIIASTGQMRISVLSLTPGAGATFLTLTIAALLGESGLTVAAAEYSNLRPEWHALMADAVKSDVKDGQGDSAFIQQYVPFKQKDKRMTWFTLHPERRSSSLLSDNEQFERMLFQERAEVNLIDFSGKWDDPHAMQLLKKSRFVCVAADPSVFKWQADDLRKLYALEQDLRAAGADLLWIANKDVRFRGRQEWMSLFPGRPKVAVPLLPQELILNALWRGRWVTEESSLQKRLIRALKPIFSLVYNEINTK